jgi:HlyD family secretion protein
VDEREDGASELDVFLGTAPPAAWRGWLVWLLIAAGAAAVALLALRFASGGSAARYVSASVVRGDLRVRLIMAGRLQPSGMTAVATAMEGVVSEILVATGDTVRTGQVLARLDPRSFQEALDEGRALLAARLQALQEAQAAATAKQARLALFSQVMRQSSGLAPSDREMRQAQGDLSAATADAGAAAVALSLARADVADRASALAATEIRAPSDGVVAQVGARIGQQLGGAAPSGLLFSIAAPYTALDLAVPAAPGVMARRVKGAPVLVVAANVPRWVFTARLIEAPAQMHVSRRMVLRVANAGGRLQPGMAATARFDLGVRSNVLIVPNAALKFAEASDSRSGTTGTQSVYILETDGTPRRQVVTALAGDGNRTEVVSEALMPGTRVILGLR